MKENVHRALERARQQISLYQWLSQAVVSGLEPDELLDQFMDLLIKEVKVEAGSIFLIREEENKLYFKVARGEKAEAVKEFVLDIGEGIAGWVAKTGVPLLVPDVQKEPRFASQISEKIDFKTRSILAAPLKIKEKVIGAIELINPVKSAFRQEDKEMLSSLGIQIALVIENARLLSQTRARIAELSGLFDVSHIITSSLAPDKLLHSIMKQAIALLNTEAISLLLIDEKTQELVFKVALGEKAREIKKFRLPINEKSIAGWVAKNGKPLSIADVNRDQRFNAHISKEIKFKTSSLLCVPLKIKEKIIGVAEAVNKSGGGAFSEEDLDLFSSIANQIAMATENDKLNEDLRNLFFSTVRSLVAAIDAKDRYTHGHSERVTDYTMKIVHALHLSMDEQENAHLSAMLHDVGKIGLKEGVLDKKEPLTEEDWAQIKRHPVVGSWIIEPVKPLASIIPNILHHHERFDGKGYPDGRKGEDIPLISRIIAVADTFDAMTSKRPYRNALSQEVALKEIEKNAGIQFDPRIAKIFLEIMKTN